MPTDATPKVPDKDDSEIMDHVAMEAIHAVHSRDHAGFKDAFRALVAHTVSEMTDTTESEED